MLPRTLPQWLEWQSTLNPVAIDLGLDRVSSVAALLPSKPLLTRVITVGGTNGKGSCVRVLETVLQASGYRVGAYTSPHLTRYNERVRIDGQDVDDATLCDAFALVERARATTPLTYFEYGTLAAFTIFWRQALDVVLLEVGLGGRLDAVNIVDSDVAIVTNIGLDHVDFLGPDRESIGFEKAGIFRAGKPAICADRDPPDTLLARARTLGTPLRLIGRDFDWHDSGQGAPSAESGWHFDGSAHMSELLPSPAARGRHQRANAAAALAALEAIDPLLSVSAASIRVGLLRATLPSRFEVIEGRVNTIVDVAHNLEAARALMATLSQYRGTGRLRAVFGMMRDKPVGPVAETLAPLIDQWFLASLPKPRGLAASELQVRIEDVVEAHRMVLCHTPQHAWQQARSVSEPGDMMLVFGSFVMAGEIRRDCLQQRKLDITGMGEQ